MNLRDPMQSRGPADRGELVAGWRSANRNSAAGCGGLMNERWAAGFHAAQPVAGSNFAA